MELVKRQDRYDLYGDDGSKIASSAPNPFGKLSKENCDEIFGVVDVDRFSHEHCDRLYHEGDINWERYRIHFKEGFSKAMELNKDKLFTVEDMRQAYDDGMNNIDADGCVIDDPDEDFIDTLKCIQQPTEIEVEAEMEEPHQYEMCSNPKDHSSCLTPKLDKNNCLILKKA